MEDTDTSMKILCYLNPVHQGHFKTCQTSWRLNHEYSTRNDVLLWVIVRFVAYFVNLSSIILNKWSSNSAVRVRKTHACWTKNTFLDPSHVLIQSTSHDRRLTETLNVPNSSVLCQYSEQKRAKIWSLWSLEPSIVPIYHTSLFPRQRMALSIIQ